MLWIDKYQPKTLSELNCHPELTDFLRNLAENKNVPHMIFYGPSGGGKKTRIMSFLHEIFGDKVYTVKSETIKPEGTAMEFISTSSNFHNLISTSELGVRDRICIQYMIKQLASQSSAAYFTHAEIGIPKYRVFVIQEAELLSYEAQAGLRRTLEKYAKNARIILHCEQLSSIIAPLKSRCLCVRVPLISSKQIHSCLQKICEAENIQNAMKVPESYLDSIISKCDSNLRRAILMLETGAMMKFPPIENLILPWQKVCKQIVQKINDNQGVQSLIECRDLLYELLTALIPGSLIIQTLLKYIVEATPSKNLCYQYIQAASYYSYAMKLGSKDIWHLEAFVAQCIHAQKVAKAT